MHSWCVFRRSSSPTCAARDTWLPGIATTFSPGPSWISSPGVSTRRDDNRAAVDGRWNILGENESRDYQGEDSDRDVDQEDRLPAERVDQPAADNRPADRAKQDGNHADRQHPGQSFRTRGAGQDDQPQRYEHSTANAFECPKDHQQPDILVL